MGKGCLCLTLSACHFNEYQNLLHTKLGSQRPHLDWEGAPPRTCLRYVRAVSVLKVFPPTCHCKDLCCQNSATFLVLDYNIGEKLRLEKIKIFYMIYSLTLRCSWRYVWRKRRNGFPDRLSSFLIRRVKINILSLLCLPSISLADERRDLFLGLRVMGEQSQKDETDFSLCQYTWSMSLEKKSRKDLSTRKGLNKESHQSKGSNTCQSNIQGKSWLVGQVF